MYNVAFRDITNGSHSGVIIWSSFSSKEAFGKWFDEKMKSSYEVVEEGISAERAVELCSSPNNTLIAGLAGVREALECLVHARITFLS